MNNRKRLSGVLRFLVIALLAYGRAYGQEAEITEGLTSMWKLVVIGATLLGVIVIVSGGVMVSRGNGVQGASAVIGGIIIAGASALIGMMNGWFGNDFANEFMAP